MVITFYLRSRLWPFKEAENPDVRTTDDHFLMEIEIHNNEQELRDLVIQATGLASDARPVGLILSCLRHLIDASDFDHTEGTTLQTNRPSERPDESAFREQVQQPATPKPQELGLNIGYNINLNLPETTDIEVFNAIFKSLKEHLLRNDDI